MSQDAISCTRLMILLQKWRGPFRGDFIVQTFAAHLTAAEGAKKIPGLHDPDIAIPVPIGALGLACASVSVIHCPREIVLIIYF